MYLPRYIHCPLVRRVFTMYCIYTCKCNTFLDTLVNKQHFIYTCIYTAFYLHQYIHWIIITKLNHYNIYPPVHTLHINYNSSHTVTYLHQNINRISYTAVHMLEYMYKSKYTTLYARKFL